MIYIWQGKGVYQIFDKDKDEYFYAFPNGYNDEGKPVYLCLPFTVVKTEIKIEPCILKHFFEHVLDEYQRDCLEEIMERENIKLRRL